MGEKTIMCVWKQILGKHLHWWWGGKKWPKTFKYQDFSGNVYLVHLLYLVHLIYSVHPIHHHSRIHHPIHHHVRAYARSCVFLWQYRLGTIPCIYHMLLTFLLLLPRLWSWKVQEPLIQGESLCCARCEGDWARAASFTWPYGPSMISLWFHYSYLLSLLTFV